MKTRASIRKKELPKEPEEQPASPPSAAPPREEEGLTPRRSSRRLRSNAPQPTVPEPRTTKAPERATRSSGAPSPTAKPSTKHSIVRPETESEQTGDAETSRRVKSHERHHPTKRSLRSNTSISAEPVVAQTYDPPPQAAKGPQPISLTKRTGVRTRTSGKEELEGSVACRKGDEEEEQPRCLEEPKSKASDGEDEDEGTKSQTSESVDKDGTKQQRVSRGERERKRSRRSGPLDEKTLDAVKTYLSTTEVCDFLDDDQLVNFMLRMDRVAVQQNKQQQILTGDSDESDSTLFDEVLIEEEEHALGHDLFKKMLTSIQEGNKDLDKRTLSWIKKAAGLHRSSGILQVRGHGTDGAELDAPKARMSTRRYTRGMAHTSRVQKRERGLNILTGVLNELEGEFGPFESSKPVHGRSISPYQADDEGASKHGEKRKGRSLIARVPKRRKIVGGSVEQNTRDVRVVRILVGGTHVTEDTEIDGRSTADKDRRKRKPGDDPVRPSIASSKTDPKKRSPCLRVLDWRRRRALLGTTEKANSRQSKVAKDAVKEHESRLDIGIPPEFDKADIVYKPPQWGELALSSDTDASLNPLGPPRRRHSDNVYASFCSKLMNCLRGDARSWAACEFFCSDIDRAWFNRNEFMEDVARLGVRPGTKLTRREWRAVRRRIPNKPRSFSRKFICKQLDKRNLYRNTVRMLQRMPELARNLDFQYDVVAPIRVGTTVTAYSSRYRIIHRGTVLGYDQQGARYLIQFERKDFGHEFCPDTEVASTTPEILVRAPERNLSGAYSILGSSFNPCSLVPPCGTSRGPVDGMNSGKTWTVKDELAGILENPQSTNGQQTSNTLLERVAENEIFVNLMSLVERAIARKKLLLDAIQDSHTLLVQRLPFGRDPSVGLPVSWQFQQHYAWLQANLERVNQVLGRALAYMRLMYGKLYAPTSLPGSNGRDGTRQNVLREILSQNVGLPPVANQWMTRLGQDTACVGDVMAAALANETPMECGQTSDRSSVVNSRLGSVGELLLAAHYGRSVANANPNIGNSAASTATSLGSLKLCSLQLPPTNNPPPQEIYAEVLAERNRAMGGLREAMDVLNSELALAGARE